MEYRSTWYLVAFCHLRQDLRLFALHRIKEYELSVVEFMPRDHTEIEAWLDSAFQLEHGAVERKVSIRFRGTSARYVRERTWHRTQELTEESDGGCVLSFTTQSLDEVKRWVLTYGSDAEVLQPKELREMVRHEVEATVALYANSLASLN
jgi:predicted DNA-binding transcriptional regulator YafY